MTTKAILIITSSVTVALILVIVLVVTLGNGDNDGTGTDSSSSSQEADTNYHCETKLCFALAGSESVSQNGFRIQKRFVTDIVSSLRLQEHRLKLAAVQYGLGNQAISPLTADVDEFLMRLGQTAFANSSYSFARGGILYCDYQLAVSEEELEGAMVLMGDGRGNFGGDPVVAAENFRRDGGTVYAVGVGENVDDGLEDVVGGDSSKLLALRSEADVDRVARTFCQMICAPQN
ncbi:von Willebrand factor A-like protein [Gracilaria domingensis]|nr:von Willebrand factor A-like protein [Gracilaria domingensis]